MIYINEKKFDKINLSVDNFYVVMDFDRTLTTHNSPGSWNVVENPNFISSKLHEESSALVDKYYPIELDYNLDAASKSMYMKEWYYKNMDLLYKYKLTNEILLMCVQNSNVTFRDGYKLFFDFLYKNNIPVIILSAGIGNVIIELLKLNNCFYDNIHVISNFIKFENNNMLPFSDEMIHTSNKNIFNSSIFNNIEIKNRKNIILLGDLIEDLNMVPKSYLDNTLSFGFLENKVDENFNFYKNAFDVVLTDNCSFMDVLNILKKKIN